MARQPDDSIDVKPPVLPRRDPQENRSHKDVAPRNPTPIQAPRPDEVDHRRFDDYYTRGLDVRTIDTARNCRRLEAQYTFLFFDTAGQRRLCKCLSWNGKGNAARVCNQENLRSQQNEMEWSRCFDG